MHLDTEIAVYTWSGVGGFAGLTKIASSDDWGSCLYPVTTYHPNSSCVTVMANPATKFWIQIDGKRNAVGNYVIDIIPFAPTAANVSVNGRITNSDGTGISRTTVLLTDNNGNTRTATTNQFGYYRFENIEVGQSYILQANSKRFQFQNNPRILSVSDNITGEDFITVADTFNKLE